LLDIPKTESMEEMLYYTVRQSPIRMGKLKWIPFIQYKNTQCLEGQKRKNRNIRGQ
jgi:hypothetical protein